MRSVYTAAICATAVVSALPALADGAPLPEPAPEPVTTEQTVDFPGFLSLSWEVRDYRNGRLISLDDFMAMSAEPDTIILDTRSAAAFATGHIEGAVNLNFSDLTELALADIVPDRTTRILIYCNNNFTDNAEPVVAKSPPLALNVPTFITLVGYGYDNVYELGELTDLDDPRLGWKRAAEPVLTAARSPIPSLEEN